jgi:hypothetical protein
MYYMGLFQNFSFWNSPFNFSGKTWFWLIFPRAWRIEPKVCVKRVLKQDQNKIFAPVHPIPEASLRVLRVRLLGPFGASRKNWKTSCNG